MSDRIAALWKIGCLVLAALMCFWVVRAARHGNPLRAVTLPEVPAWSPSTEATDPAGPPAGGNPSVPASLPSPGMGPPPSVGPPAGGRGGSTVPPLPPDTQKRVDYVVQSQLLGPVMRPPPMALLGIAGPDVLFRGPQGQSGLLRVGEELGGVRLIRIGTNRVLVQENGQLKELTLFDGLGSESLLPSPGQSTIP